MFPTGGTSGARRLQGPGHPPEGFVVGPMLSAPDRTHSMPAVHARLKELEEFLVRARNADGGWAYHPDKRSRLEPTCWAILALGEAGTEPTALEQWPLADGLLLERRGGSPNYAFHGLGLLALRARRLEHSGSNASLLAALQRVKGNVVPQSDTSRQDNSLQGWSWIADTFSWVEPTAWCLLALKQWARKPGISIDNTRVEVAERLLIDRCCVTGGWNYGNSNVLGQELRPFVPTTAIALLALQDRKSLPEVQRSIDFLEREATTERSGSALALALMALSALERPVATVRDALIAQVPTTIEFGNHAAAAMALYALEGEGHAAVIL